MSMLRGKSGAVGINLKFYKETKETGKINKMSNKTPNPKVQEQW